MWSLAYDSPEIVQGPARRRVQVERPDLPLSKIKISRNTLCAPERDQEEFIFSLPVFEALKNAKAVLINATAIRIQVWKDTDTHAASSTIPEHVESVSISSAAETATKEKLALGIAVHFCCPERGRRAMRPFDSELRLRARPDGVRPASNVF